MNDFLNDVNPRMIALSMILIVGLLITLQLMYLLWPEYRKYQTLTENYQLLQKVSNSSHGLEQELLKTEQQVEELSYQLHGDMAGLPEKQMEAFIIGHLQRISWDAGVELASVIPGKGRRVEIFQEALFDLQVNAAYQDFFKWLQDINSELGFIVVKKFDIQSAVSAIEEDPQLKITLTLVSYRMVKDD